jgi:hypothetical protein
MQSDTTTYVPRDPFSVQCIMIATPPFPRLSTVSSAPVIGDGTGNTSDRPALHTSLLSCQASDHLLAWSIEYRSLAICMRAIPLACAPFNMRQGTSYRSTYGTSFLNFIHSGPELYYSYWNRTDWPGHGVSTQNSSPGLNAKNFHFIRNSRSRMGRVKCVCSRQSRGPFLPECT